MQLFKILELLKSLIVENLIISLKKLLKTIKNHEVHFEQLF